MLPIVGQLEGLVLHDFMCFAHAELRFLPGINVFIGENGTGKTALLKLMYASLRGLNQRTEVVRVAKADTETATAARLMGVFKPDRLGRLVRRRQGRAASSVELSFLVHEPNGDDWVWRKEPASFSFSIGSQAVKRVTVADAVEPLTAPALFLPSREVLSIYPGFLSLYERHEIHFDETYRDLCEALGHPKLRGPRSAFVSGVFDALAERLGATVRLKDDRFYIAFPGQGEFEAALVSEGLRKLGVLMHLVLNGMLTDKYVLFWDEPESSLNPKYVAVLVEVLKILASEGVQVFLASHDYLLTQKLSLIAESDDKTESQFFSLNAGDEGVTVEQASTLLDLKHNPIADEFEAHYSKLLQ